MVYYVFLSRLLQEELCRRLGTRPELSHSWSSDSLTYALKESLSLEGNTADRTNFQDFHRLSNQDILRKLLRCREEVHSSITITLLNSDKLLGRDVEFPQKRIDKFSWPRFFAKIKVIYRSHIAIVYMMSIMGFYIYKVVWPDIF